MGYYREWYTALRGLRCITLLPHPISSSRCPKFKNWSPTPFLCILNARRRRRVPGFLRLADLQFKSATPPGCVRLLTQSFRFLLIESTPARRCISFDPPVDSSDFFKKKHFIPPKKVLSRAPLRIDRLCFHNATSCLFKSVGAIPSPSKSAEKIPNPLNF